MTAKSAGERRPLIVCYVLVKRLCVEEALHTPTPVPGRDPPGQLDDDYDSEGGG